MKSNETYLTYLKLTQLKQHSMVLKLLNKYVFKDTPSVRPRAYTLEVADTRRSLLDTSELFVWINKSTEDNMHINKDE